MRHTRRIALAVGAAGLLLGGLAPALPITAAAAASKITIQTYSASNYQYEKYCSGSTCNLKRSTILDFEFIETGTLNIKPVTIHWQLQDVTTQAGVDYSGPTSGQVSIPSGSCANCAFVLVPIVNEGAPDDTETVNFVVTSTSVPATVNNGTGTIFSQAQIPEDCSLAFVTTASKSLTCTNRPAGQVWFFRLGCPDGKFSEWTDGNAVTGDGTSTADCGVGSADDTGFFEVSG
jgi:hypothetical protein